MNHPTPLPALRLATAALALTGSLLAQNWTQIAPGAPAPSPRAFQGMAYNLASNTTLLFGGLDTVATFSDTWQLAGSTWSQLSPATVPTGRDSHVMAYDASRNRTVMFGGWDQPGNVLNDTWEWNGSNWQQMSPAVSPSPRTDAGMVYDAARNVCVLFGGFEPNTAIGFNDTWEWNGSTWTQVAALNPPGPRDGFGFAYDAGRNRTVLFGGWDPNSVPLNETWEFNGSAWTRITTQTAPSARFYTSMAYDASRGRCVLYGGEDTNTIFGETWEYNGSNWTLSSATGPTNPLEAMVLVYDNAAARTVLFGGADSQTSPSGTTWELRGGGAQASYARYGSGCPGSNGVPSLTGTGVPSMGSSFAVRLTNLPTSGGVAYMVLGFSDTTWNGQPLPASLAPFGFPAACRALLSPDDGALIVNSGGSATWTVAIPTSPAFAGFRFFNQGASFDVGAPGGIAFSNGGRGVVH